MTDGNYRTGSEHGPGDDVTRDARDSFLVFFDDLPNPIWRAGPDGKCDYFNREWLAFTGRTFSQEKGDGWEEGVHPEDLDRCDRIFREAFARRQPFVMEYRLRYHDGSYRWLLDNGKPYYHPDGTFAGYIGSCYDIDDRKQAQDAVQAAVRLNQEIDTLSLEECLISTIDEAERLTASRIGFFHFVNDDEKTVRLAAWSTETKKHCSIPMEPDRSYPVEKGGVWLDCLRERRPVIHNDYAGLPHKKGLPAGHVPVTRELVVPIFDADKIVAIIGVGNKTAEYDGRDSDIVSLLAKNTWTLIRRKRAEESLRESERRYRDMFEINNAVMFVVDPASCLIVDANDAACRYYGYLREEMQGLSITQINTQDPEISKKDLAAAAERPGAVFRFRHKKKSGGIRDVEVFSSRIIVGERVLLHTIVQDITERVRAIEALRESREQYRELVENISEAIVSLDREGKFTYVSPVVKRLYGYSQKDLIGQHFLQFVHPKDRERISASFKDDLSGIYNAEEFRVLGRDGSIHWISASPHIREQNGSVTGFNYVMADITGRKCAEEEERLTCERFETLVKVTEMQDAGESQVSGYVLQAACRMTGSLFASIGAMAPDESILNITSWSPETMSECRVSSPPFRFPVQTACIWEDVIRECRPKIVNDYAAACPGSEELPKGYVRISRFLSVPILENGKVVMVAVVANKPVPYDDADVTRLTLLMQGIWGSFQKRQADDALRQSEEKFRLFFNNVNDAVYVHRMDPGGRPGKFVEVNDVLCQRLGYTREELLAVPVADILSDEGIRRMQKVMGMVAQNGRATFETEHRCKNGSILPVEVSTHCFMQGQILFALATARDISGRKKAEAVLKKSEALLNEMGRLAQIGGWEFDVQTEELVMTAETYRISGTPEGETLDLVRALSYFDPPGRAVLEAAVKRCTDSGEPFDLELPVTTATGRHIWTRVIGHAVRQDKKTEKITGTLQDITARRQAEEALRESRQLLEAVLNSITVRVFWKDKNLVFLGCNMAFARDAGYEKPEDVIGKDDYAMAWREQAEIYRTDDRNVIETGTEKLLFEEPQTTRSGEKVYLLTSKVPLKDADGQVFGVLGTYLNITERKKAEEALRESEVRFRELFNSMGSGVAVYRPVDGGADFEIVDFNHGAEVIDRIKKQEVIGRRVTEVFPGVGDFGLLDVFLRVWQTGTPEHHPAALYRDERIASWRENYVYRLPTGEVVAIYDDVTEQKKAEELLHDFNRELGEQVKAQTEKINASLNEKVVLLREIHHRVKNNLQLIISLTNLQMRQSGDEQLIQIMKETQNRVRAMSLVHEKLYQSEDIARISLAEYTRFLATQLFAFYGVNSRQVKLEIDIGKIMLDINTAIPTGLIINELVSNALKHAFLGSMSGVITIAAREEGNTLVLSIRDTGVGMPPGMDWKESQSLGLRLVRILTEQLNGTIELQPVEKGTAFFIRVTKAKGAEGGGR